MLLVLRRDSFQTNGDFHPHGIAGEYQQKLANSTFLGYQNEGFNGSFPSHIHSSGGGQHSALAITKYSSSSTSANSKPSSSSKSLKRWVFFWAYRVTSSIWRMLFLWVPDDERKLEPTRNFASRIRSNAWAGGRLDVPLKEKIGNSSKNDPIWGFCALKLSSSFSLLDKENTCLPDAYPVRTVDHWIMPQVHFDKWNTVNGLGSYASSILFHDRNWGIFSPKPRTKHRSSCS